jgi:hypothetical protein
MSLSCYCCLLSGSGLCVWLIIRPEESYPVWCVCVCVIFKARQRGGPGPQGAVVPWKKCGSPLSNGDNDNDDNNLNIVAGRGNCLL